MLQTLGSLRQNRHKARRAQLPLRAREQSIQMRMLVCLCSLVDPEANDISFGELVMCEFAGDTATAHHIGAVANMDDLDLLRADHENGRATMDQAIEQPEYFSLGADVDTACRLIKNIKSRICV